MYSRVDKTSASDNSLTRRVMSILLASQLSAALVGPIPVI